jgi:hypothetical protein
VNETVTGKQIPALPPGVTIGSVTDRATRGPVSMSATSTLSPVSIEYHGVEVFSAKSMSTSVVCTFGQSQTTHVKTDRMRVLGAGVTVGDDEQSLTKKIGDDTVEIYWSKVTFQNEVLIRVGIYAIPPEGRTGERPNGIQELPLGTWNLARTHCTTPLYADAPTVTKVEPSGPTTGGTLVTVTGTNFVEDGTTLTIDGEPHDTAVANHTTLVFFTPPGTAGPVPITVTTAGGTATGAFTYTEANDDSSVLMTTTSEAVNAVAETWD